jgi:hypothetical protein
MELVQEMDQDLKQSDNILSQMGTSSGSSVKLDLRLKYRSESEQGSIGAGVADNHSSDEEEQPKRSGSSAMQTKATLEIEWQAQRALSEEAGSAARLAVQEEQRSFQVQKKWAKSLQVEATEYLPQLVSAILHAPLAMASGNPQNPHAVDPIFALRKLILSRCIKDPNFGVLLCWLLEAEVGRAWKPEFEHLQQTVSRNG